MRFLVPADAQSWAEVEPSSDFPIQNLPFGVSMDHQIFCRIGDMALPVDTPGRDSLEQFSADELGALRQRCFEILESGSSARPALVPVDRLRMTTPCRIRQYVDFYSGIHHAANVGRLFRPDMPPLLPNYRHVPLAYNGRSNTVRADLTEVRRPYGQFRPHPDQPPIFAPTQELDFEVELATFVGAGFPPGPVSPDEAQRHLLGVVLLNDWSSRDVQRWENQPLGPFLAKSFATSISPWLVTFDALRPFHLTPMEQEEPLPYLRQQARTAWDISLSVQINGHPVTRSNARHVYWSFGQQLAHQASNGTPIEAGDLYATGTLSGPEEGEFGSLLELTARGRQPIVVGSDVRAFLADGDEVTMTGLASQGNVRVGFGALRQKVTPA